MQLHWLAGAALLAAISLAPTPARAQAPACARTCVRREIRTLSVDERNRYTAAVRAIMENGQYDELLQAHLDQAQFAHNSPGFLVWHRAMIKRFEDMLGAVDPTVCAHYWAWELDSQAPEAAPIWGLDAFGSTTRCINMSWLPAGRGCVERDWTVGGGGLGTFASPELINRLIANGNSYEAFRQPYEAGPHATPHINVGGALATMRSPSDPLFYLHHSNVERHYVMWQAAQPAVARTYPGNTGRTLTPFAWTIEQVFDSSALCYSYADVTAGTPTALAAGLRRRQVNDEGAPRHHHHHADTPHMGVPQFNLTAGNTSVAAVEYYAPTDRGNLRALRYVSPATEAYINMMGLNATLVREYEASWRRMVDAINEVKGYVSPVALCRRRDLVSHLVANGTSPSTFYVDWQRQRVPVPLSNSTLDTLLQAVNQAAPGVVAGGESVRAAVVQIAGPWKGDRASVANFERAATGGAEPVTPPEKSNTDATSGAARVATGLLGMVAAVMAVLA